MQGHLHHLPLKDSTEHTSLLITDLGADPDFWKGGSKSEHPMEEHAFSDFHYPS